MSKTEWKDQYDVASNIAETLKKHHQYRSVRHDGSRVYYVFDGKKIVVNFGISQVEK